MPDRRLTALLIRTAVVVAAVGTMAFQSAEVVSGRITDTNGRPLANAVVTARFQPGGGRAGYMRSARTDANGRYVIRATDRSGAWSVRAHAEFGRRSLSLTFREQGRPKPKAKITRR